jgi:hypothetical protein
MDPSPLWVLVAAFVGALVPGIFVLLQLSAASKERLEAIYERLLSDLNNVVKEMGNWDGNTESLSDDKKRTISRMLHMHLDGLVESIALEGRSGWRKFLYKLGVGKLWYEELGGEWFLEKHRYRKFEYWYSVTLMLYNEVLGASEYVEEVFHLITENHPHGDPHKNICGSDCLKTYFTNRLEHERERNG